VNLCYQDDQYQNLGNIYIMDSFAEKNLDSRIKVLDKAKGVFENGQDPFKAQVCILTIICFIYTFFKLFQVDAFIKICIF